MVKHHSNVILSTAHYKRGWMTQLDMTVCCCFDCLDLILHWWRYFKLKPHVLPWRAYLIPVALLYFIDSACDILSAEHILFYWGERVVRELSAG